MTVNVSLGTFIRFLIEDGQYWEDNRYQRHFLLNYDELTNYGSF